MFFSRSAIIIIVLECCLLSHAANVLKNAQFEKMLQEPLPGNSHVNFMPGSIDDQREKNIANPKQSLNGLFLALSGTRATDRHLRKGTVDVARRRAAVVANDAEARMKAVLEAEKDLDSKPPEDTISFTNIDDGPVSFPLAAVIGQEAIKTALLMSGVNPLIRGVVISGGRGTCKSVMAKGIHQVLPPIERVKGSAYNIDPSLPTELDTFTEKMLEETGKSLKDFETEVIPTPFVQLPINVLEDRLIGSIDVERSLQEGRQVFLPGLLASSHRGVLYVDDINLLDETTVNTLLEALSAGYVRVEREGLSVTYPFRPILIATFNPEEAELREHLMDRIGTCLSADAVPLSIEEKTQATINAMEFGDDPVAFCEKFKDETEAMQTSITFAREYLKDMKVNREQFKYLCENAIRAGVQGSRGEIFAGEVSRASAALNGGDRVAADDLNLGVKLCIIPRGTEIQTPMQEDDLMPPPPPPPPQQQEQDQDVDEENKEEPEPPEPDEDQQEEAPAIPQEFMIDAEGIVLDPDILNFAASQKRAGGAGKRGIVWSDETGRHVKSMIPKSQGIKKLDITATLIQAAPAQKGRRARHLAKNPGSTKKVFIDRSDARAKRFAKKTGSLVVFVVDASGSMALNRMNAAKGAAIDLLIEAYQSRDKVSLITIQGDAAQVILPPTKSITMAKRRLEMMPCGGGSPLADALNAAAQVGLTTQKVGEVGEVVVIVITDGRANVPLAKSQGNMAEDDPMPDKKEIKEEVLEQAKVLGRLPGFKLLVLDTENKFVSTGVAKEIANVAGGQYSVMPKAAQQSSMVSAAKKGLGW